MNTRSDLRRLQDTQLSLLRELDGVCARHGIRYFLYAGTLLGAVRHGGFIPWDDDLDVCMERPEYDRFLAAWASEPHPDALLQTKDTSPAYMNSFAKLRRRGTTFLEHGRDAGRFHTGIFLDVFPLDRCPAGGVGRAVFRLRCLLLQLFTREYAPPRAGRVTRLGAALLLFLVRGRARRAARSRLERSITRHSGDRTLPLVGIETAATLRVLYPADLADDLCRLRFEDGEYPCFARWDDYLTRKYGDYTRLPPPSERVWKHRPLVLDFDREIAVPAIPSEPGLPAEPEAPA